MTKLKFATRLNSFASKPQAEWPAVKAAFEAWLAPDNFDSRKAQRRTLEALRQG